MFRLTKPGLAALVISLLGSSFTFAAAPSDGGTDSGPPPPGKEPTIEELIARGEQLYNMPGSCIVCHGDKGQGGVGPDFLSKPALPSDIAYQMQSNPQMAAVAIMLSEEGENLPPAPDLFALSFYIHDLTGGDLTKINRFGEVNKINDLRMGIVREEVVLEGRDAIVEEISPFDTVLNNWVRKSKTGSLKKSYKATVVGTYEAGEPAFTPEPGKTYYYENLDTPTSIYMHDISDEAAKTSQIMVGDAETLEVIASRPMPENLSGQVHTTVLTPDGRYAYITGPAAKGAPEGYGEISSPASLLKIDALTLQPVKQIIVGARLHHAQLYKDKYIQMDVFARDPDGLNVFLFDPETDEVLGGVQCEDLGGACYTSYNDGHYIYVLMAPSGYGPPAFSGILGSFDYIAGKRTVLRPFWVAKLDPDTWEVVREYPYPGYRGNWIAFDAAKENMYVPAGATSNVSKINIESGFEWAASSGIGPYGANIAPNGKDLWVADKGETTGFLGRTITIINTETAAPTKTLFSGYTVDHVLLSPNGKEMWASSNGDGTVHVFDVETYEKIDEIQMPSSGSPHGTVWVHYDKDGSGRVVRDQGGFHGGVDPLNGKPLDY